MYLFTKQIDRYRKQIYSYQGGKWGGINWEVGIDIYILLYIKYITNKDILYSTGNYTQYFVITYKGNKSEKEFIYIFIFSIYSYILFIN